MGDRRAVGQRKVVGLPVIMRSSVFRCRSASPYRYVSSPSLIPPPARHPPPAKPPTTHLAPLGDQMASPIRVIPNILFLFRNQISRRAPAYFYGSLLLSPFFFLVLHHSRQNAAREIFLCREKCDTFCSICAPIFYQINFRQCRWEKSLTVSFYMRFA